MAASDPTDLFDGDRISQMLFAAAERLGTPDPFLARELSDSVVHFLRVEFEGSQPSPAAVLEAIEKILGELGNPRIARALVAGADEFFTGPLTIQAVAMPTLADLRRRSLNPRLREWSLANIFPPQVTAAIEQGLVTPGELESPLQLAGGYLESSDPGGDALAFLDQIEVARSRYSTFVALDVSPTRDAAALTRALLVATRLSGLRAVVHFNRRRNDRSTADERDLFGHPANDSGDSMAMAKAIVEALSGSPADVEIAVHLGQPDWDVEPVLGDLITALHCAGGASLYFDRPRRPTWLAEGLPDDFPAVLTTVELDLASLLRVSPSIQDAGQFQTKLGSMARLALSVGHAWLDHLRRMGSAEVRQGFLAERSVLVVRVTGWAEVSEKLALGEANRQQFRGQCWRLIRDALADDRPHGLRAVLAGDPWEGEGPLLAARYRGFEGATRQVDPGGDPLDLATLKQLVQTTDVRAVHFGSKGRSHGLAAD